MRRRDERIALLAALTGILVVLAGLILVPDSPRSPGRDNVVTVPVDGGGDEQVADTKLEAPAEDVDTAQASPEIGADEGLRDETPPGVPDALLDRAREQQERLAASDQLPLITPDAAPSQRGCESRFVKNFSSRRGVRPRLWVIHFTVSGNRPGKDDMNAVTSLANSSRYQVSWSYLIDRDGHCYYSVREVDKPWTQGAANPLSISAEIINSGRERNLIDGAGLKKIGRVISDSAKRWDIPLRKGAVNGCSVKRAGIVDHRALGQCGGGHVDVTHHYPKGLDQVIAAAKAARSRSSSHRELHQRIRRLCSTKAKTAKHPEACRKLRARNRAYHKR